MSKAQSPKLGRPSSGKAQTAAERMRRYRARHRAAGLRTVTRHVAPVQTLVAGALKHRILDARSLAMHCLAAAKIERNAALLRDVEKTFEGWRKRYAKELPPALEEWRLLLERPWPEVCAVITDPGERASRLRQSSPFSTLLSPGERKRIYDAFRP